MDEEILVARKDELSHAAACHPRELRVRFPRRDEESDPIRLQRRNDCFTKIRSDANRALQRAQALFCIQIRARKFRRGVCAARAASRVRPGLRRLGLAVEDAVRAASKADDLLHQHEDGCDCGGEDAVLNRVDEAVARDDGVEDNAHVDARDTASRKCRQVGALDDGAHHGQIRDAHLRR